MSTTPQFKKLSLVVNGKTVCPGRKALEAGTDQESQRRWGNGVHKEVIEKAVMEPLTL